MLAFGSRLGRGELHALTLEKGEETRQPQRRPRRHRGSPAACGPVSDRPPLPQEGQLGHVARPACRRHPRSAVPASRLARASGTSSSVSYIFIKLILLPSS